MFAGRLLESSASKKQRYSLQAEKQCQAVDNHRRR
jgi:hypothetical protein